MLFQLAKNFARTERRVRTYERQDPARLWCFTWQVCDHATQCQVTCAKLLALNMVCYVIAYDSFPHASSPSFLWCLLRRLVKVAEDCALLLLLSGCAVILILLLLSETCQFVYNLLEVCWLSGWLIRRVWLGGAALRLIKPFSQCVDLLLHVLYETADAKTCDGTNEA